MAGAPLVPALGVGAGLAPALAAAGVAGAAGPNVVNVQIEVHAGPGTDPLAIRRLLRDVVPELQRELASIRV